MPQMMAMAIEMRLGVLFQLISPWLQKMLNQDGCCVNITGRVFHRHRQWFKATEQIATNNPNKTTCLAGDDGVLLAALLE